MEPRAPQEKKASPTLAVALFPPGLTCPGAARMCSGAGVASTDVSTTALGELDRCRGLTRPPFMYTLVGPAPWLAPPPASPRNPRTPGHRAFTRFICFSGKVNYTGLSHIESRGGSKGTSAEALSSRTWQLKEGGGPCHCWEPPQRGTFLPPLRGRAETGRAGFRRPLHGSAEVRGGLSLGTRRGGCPRRGTQDEAWSSYSPHRRGSVSVGMNVPLRTSVAATWEMCVHIWVSAAHRMRVPHPSPLLARGVRLMWGWVANGGLLLQPRGKLPAPGCVPLHCPECAKPSRAGGGPDLWGMAGETQDPGPSSLKNGLGSPSRFPKLAPGGRKAQ